MNEAIVNEINSLRIGDAKALIEKEVGSIGTDLVISSPEVYEEAGARIKTLKASAKTLEDKRKELVEPYIKGKKLLDDFFKKPIAQIEDACRRISAKMSDFRREQERIAAREQARIDEINRKEAEKLEKRAEKAEASGKDGKAEELRQEAEQVKMSAPVVTREVPKATTVRVNWKFRIIDPGKLDRKWMKPDEVAIGMAVRALKGEFNEAGIQVYSEETDY